ncbi:MAG: hypothetical protein WCC94_02305 [Candidatus Bathyarchaeia archaeon]
MKWYHLIWIAVCVVLVSVPAVRADYTLSVDKSSYQVGDTLIVNVCTEGGKVTLTLSGPYTAYINLGDLAKGCYRIPLGETEQRDVGFWTITMSVDNPVPLFQLPLSSNPPRVSFTVFAVPEFPIPALVMGIVLVGASFMVRFGIRKKEVI